MLGWECCQHVGDKSAQQPNVGPTQPCRANTKVSGMADIYPFLLLVPEVCTHNLPKTSTHT